jgi:hypothetical protein
MKPGGYAQARGVTNLIGKVKPRTWKYIEGGKLYRELVMALHARID